MATDNIVAVRIGVPGPPGAGVSSAEKATFVTLSNSSPFTAAQIIRVSSTGAFRVESGSNTTDRTLVVDSTNKEVELWNAAKLRGFSLAGANETWSIDSNTGNAQLDGVLTVSGGRVVSDLTIWPLYFDGGGSTIGTGVKFDIVVPYNALVTRWDLYADQTGSIVIDIWQDSYSNFPPTNADSITTSEKPTLSSAVKNQDTSLNSGNGWALTRGNVLRFNVDSATTVTKATLALWITRT